MHPLARLATLRRLTARRVRSGARRLTSDTAGGASAEEGSGKTSTLRYAVIGGAMLVAGPGAYLFYNFTTDPEFAAAVDASFPSLSSVMDSLGERATEPPPPFATEEIPLSTTMRKELGAMYLLADKQAARGVRVEDVLELSEALAYDVAPLQGKLLQGPSAAGHVPAAGADARSQTKAAMPLRMRPYLSAAAAGDESEPVARISGSEGSSSAVATPVCVDDFLWHFALLAQAAGDDDDAIMSRINRLRARTGLSVQQWSGFDQPRIRYTPAGGPSKVQSGAAVGSTQADAPAASDASPSLGAPAPRSALAELRERGPGPRAADDRALVAGNTVYLPEQRAVDDAPEVEIQLVENELERTEQELLQAEAELARTGVTRRKGWSAWLMGDGLSVEARERLGDLEGRQRELRSELESMRAAAARGGGKRES